MSYSRVKMNGHTFEMKGDDVWVNGRRIGESDLEPGPRPSRWSLGLVAVMVAFLVGVLVGILVGG